jgi:excisionase family DNA binding protein
MEDLLTVDEAARALRVTRGTLYRKIQTGQVRAVRLGTGEKAPIRIEEGELERYTRASTIGDDIAIRAEQLVARRGEDPDDANAYAEALRELGYEAEVFIDRTAKALTADVEAAHRAAGHRAVGSHQRVGSDVVDVEKIVNEELDRLGPIPWPVGVQRLGPRGVGREALRILSEKGLDSYDERAYRAAVRQAIREAINPKRSI